jgi:uncharacterized protein with PQ loop repeat
MFSIFDPLPADVLHAITWLYFASNSARILTFIPQIVAVYRCRDGAKAISLITWGSWVVSHFFAVLYAIVQKDLFFLLVSIMNFVCNLAVFCIVVQRRRDFSGRCEQTPNLC